MARVKMDYSVEKLESVRLALPKGNFTLEPERLLIYLYLIIFVD